MLQLEIARGGRNRPLHLEANKSRFDSASVLWVKLHQTNSSPAVESTLNVVAFKAGEILQQIHRWQIVLQPT